MRKHPYRNYNSRETLKKLLPGCKVKILFGIMTDVIQVDILLYVAPATDIHCEHNERCYKLYDCTTMRMFKNLRTGKEIRVCSGYMDIDVNTGEHIPYIPYELCEEKGDFLNDDLFEI